jgi:hypothetical protein
LTFINNMVNFFANSSNFSIRSKLTNNVFVITALSESFWLINRFHWIFDNIFKAQWTKLIPFFFCGLKSYSLWVFRSCIWIWVFIMFLRKEWQWSLQLLWRLHLHLLDWNRRRRSHISFFECILFSWNLPKIKFFIKINFIIWI